MCYPTYARLQLNTQRLGKTLLPMFLNKVADLALCVVACSVAAGRWFSESVVGLYGYVGMNPGVQLVTELNTTNMSYVDLSTLALTLPKRQLALQKSTAEQRLVWEMSHGGDSERFACGPCAKPIFCTHLLYAGDCPHGKIWACTRTQTLTLFCPMYSFVGGTGWVRLSAAQQNPSSFRLGPCPRGSQGPLGIISRPSPPLVQVWRHFATFFARCGARAFRGQNKGFPRSGRMQGSIGPER